MYIIYGSGLYGKVDHVPGLFYVATEFFHIWWIPVCPTGSYLMLDDNTGESGVPINLSIKSWLMGWFRAACFIVGVILLAVGIFSTPRRPEDDLRMWHLLGGAGLLVLGFASYFVIGIGRRRAAWVAECAKLDPSFVHDYFDRLQGMQPVDRDEHEDHDRSTQPADGRLLDEALQRWNPKNEN